MAVWKQLKPLAGNDGQASGSFRNNHHNARQLCSIEIMNQTMIFAGGRPLPVVSTVEGAEYHAHVDGSDGDEGLCKGQGSWESQ